jgi:hypothetical protein
MEKEGEEVGLSGFCKNPSSSILKKPTTHGDVCELLVYLTSFGRESEVKYKKG